MTIEEYLNSFPYDSIFEISQNIVSGLTSAYLVYLLKN